VLYMLNQLGAALGVAVVTLIIQTISDPMTGFHNVFWLVVAVILIILAAIPLLPGRPQPPAATEELAAKDEVAVPERTS